MCALAAICVSPNGFWLDILLASDGRSPSRWIARYRGRHHTFSIQQHSRVRWPRKVLIARLQDLYSTNAIHILNIGKPTLHGDWDGHRIRVNSAHLNSLQAGLRLGALSLVLVHEGTHAIVHMPDIYDEIGRPSAPDPLLPRIDRPRRIQRGERSAGSGGGAHISRSRRQVCRGPKSKARRLPATS